MDATTARESTPTENRTTVERTSQRELVVTRTFNAPARIVFEAWTRPELFRRWWLPKALGMSLRSCEMDVRVGGKYRLEFEPDGTAFFGTYLDVIPHSRLLWTNEEGGESGSVTVDSVQFSTLRPGIRAMCSRLAPRTTACAAIAASRSSIRVPRRSSVALMRPYA